MDSVLPLHPHQDHSPSHPMELSQWTLQTSIKWADNWYETLQCISWEKKKCSFHIGFAQYQKFISDYKLKKKENLICTTFSAQCLLLES